MSTSTMSMPQQFVLENVGGERACNFCGKTASASSCAAAATSTTALRLKLCSRCKSVSYCSRECQARDWRAGGHAYQCRPPPAQVESSSTTTDGADNSSFEDERTEAWRMFQRLQRERHEEPAIRTDADLYLEEAARMGVQRNKNSMRVPRPAGAGTRWRSDTDTHTSTFSSDRNDPEEQEGPPRRRPHEEPDVKKEVFAPEELLDEIVSRKTGSVCSDLSSEEFDLAPGGDLLPFSEPEESDDDEEQIESCGEAE